MTSEKAREILAAECSGVIGTALEGGSPEFDTRHSMISVEKALRAIDTALSRSSPPNEGVIEEVKKALRPFANVAAEIETCAVQYPKGAPERDLSAWSTAVPLEACQEARRLLTLLEGGGK